MSIIFSAIVVLTMLVAGCAPPTDSTSDETATLLSLQKVDDYPLYTMQYYGAYDTATSQALAAPEQPADRLVDLNPIPAAPAWACSLFAALGDPSNLLYGRNFDWQFSPALLLFTDPPDGYASVSMVDIAYFGFSGEKSKNLLELPISELQALMRTVQFPFDGMNEHGLAVGMAAVPPGGMRSDPAKETIGSLGVIRQMLDHAKNVDEAVAVLQSYNIDFEGGPPVHYLLADRSGQAVLVEFFRGQIEITPNEGPWHQATNFIRAAAGASAEGSCWRHDLLSQGLSENEGLLSTKKAMDMLQSVSQASTQWSIVYGMSTGKITVSIGRGYENVHTFQLNP
jgi:hypothetical protein